MRRFSGLLISGLLIVGGLIGCTCTTMEVEVGFLSITADEIVAGESFNVEAGITNIGENDGTFTASIRIDERVVDKKKVSIAAGATEIVRFDCIAETPGIHNLRLNDSTATFTALKPADFEVTFLSIPTEAYTRQATIIEANVTNTRKVEGIYNGRLMVNGTEKASNDTMLTPSATETISLTITIDTPGTYTISLDGATATLTVFLAFPDANLEAVIRENLNKPKGPIYMADMETIIILEAEDRDISDLTGLEFCTNLQELHLSENYISDISPLTSLTNLSGIGIFGNNISDISPLASLTKLGELNLGGNNISDISPLDGLTNLEGLFLHENNISDISSLQNLTNLRILHLSINNVSDISPLIENSGLSAGDTMDLSKNPLSTTSLNVYIPQLKARGVDVTY
ncbi:leucine-rich repeat domain-containing protein [Chloroflexota bacterium]